ncbi:hypothetical protein GA707_17975 [Nostocoides sp. F2B08]|uniref:DUF5995 family protein n=1 Tax=Nostocoides sp. F2B08 TaxID=2653936 RepID=UPI001263B74B|nr:DUF5995 family protein [Tetrasphaera sp. F2B08]KAB7741433.1 hypothetical protein GA707_17975 [Tetrasphaera sp. F2B08]
MDTIDEAIAAMDRRIERALDTGDPRGYFTCVYRSVTARVRDGIRAGEFDDCERMERFDVAFARLYLDAADGFEAGGAVSRSWRVVFDAPPSALAVQHVIAGMNAHINLDLGLAAASVQHGEAVADLRDDFERLNDVLAAMIDRMQDALTHTAPWTGILDTWGGRVDELVSGWSIEYARGRAWSFAERLAVAEDGERQSLVASRDERVAAIGEGILNPPLPVQWLTALVAPRERADLRAVVESLVD